MSYALIFSLLNSLFFFPLVSFDILSRTPSLPVFSILCVCSVPQLCTTLCDPMDCSHQAALSVGFSRQEYWSGLPFFPPGYRLRPGVEPMFPASPALQVDSLLLMSSKEIVWKYQRYLKPTYSESILIIRFIRVCLRWWQNLPHCNFHTYDLNQYIKVEKINKIVIIFSFSK